MFTEGTGTIQLTTTNSLPVNDAGGEFGNFNNLAINGGITTVAKAITVGGTLTISNGSLVVPAFAFSVTGTTSVSDTLQISSTTGAKTFTGNVTINAGGVWNNSANAAVGFGGNLQNDGVFTAGSGTQTFSGSGKTIGGANPITIPNLTISGTTTNNGTLTVSTALAGSSTLTNGGGATLNYAGSSVAPTLTASAAGNTVNYTGASQTVKPTTYLNLGLAGSNTKTMTSVSTVNGNLTLSGTASATAATNLTVGGNLAIGSGDHQVQWRFGDRESGR